MYAQYVKNTMQPLNIADVTKDQSFPWTREHTDQTSHRIKSLLCTPIRNGKKDKVIGVCQLVNKMDEASGSLKAFNRNDEQFLEAFAIFCGLGIQNTQMYETVERAMAKQEVTLEENLTRPKENRTRPKENRTRPKENLTRPKENLTRPKENLTRPKENLTRPKENLTRPKENLT
ncbi:cGMP-specific 3',5'-cyclic phosphodiesterase [Liparis tanakae]|uniref:cGMP-specific 3',5'-cyclic phosphodiesterase n=1 Tax=Liparis tanakae TaxID=230148 RepID=A0A4Z2ERU7_9TELE|nr:cGMP-specific 3',5'-cyclic phosphodiesterase [Liparis tanakae]